MDRSRREKGKLEGDPMNGRARLAQTVRSMPCFWPEPDASKGALVQRVRFAFSSAFDLRPFEVRVAEAIGLSAESVAAMLTGGQPLTHEVLVAIAAARDVSLHWLCTGEGDVLNPRALTAMRESAVKLQEADPGGWWLVFIAFEKLKCAAAANAMELPLGDRAASLHTVMTEALEGAAKDPAIRRLDAYLRTQVMSAFAEAAELCKVGEEFTNLLRQASRAGDQASRDGDEVAVQKSASRLDGSH